MTMSVALIPRLKFEQNKDKNKFDWGFLIGICVFCSPYIIQRQVPFSYNLSPFEHKILNAVVLPSSDLI